MLHDVMKEVNDTIEKIESVENNNNSKKDVKEINNESIMFTEDFLNIYKKVVK